VAGPCEHGNEPSGSIKCGEFLDKLSVLLASQEGLCFMELVSIVMLSNYLEMCASVLLSKYIPCDSVYLTSINVHLL
jgi:hypothetical protein